MSYCNIFLSPEKKEKENKKNKTRNGDNHHFYTIKITERDDLLIEYYNDYVLNPAKICHDYCYGMIGANSFKTYKILYCKKCNLRIEVPFYIITFKELKEYFENKFKEKIEKVTRAELIDMED